MGRLLSGDEQDEQFHGEEHRDGDIERDGECERAIQCGVGRQLQSGRQREPDGGGGRSVRAVASNYNQSVSFTGGSGTNTTVSGSATNAPVPTPILQVTPGSIGYGTMLVGTSKTNSFTVQNVGTGTLSGTASVSAPFSVVSGGSYSLGANASQTVVVAFSPSGGEQLQPECELYGREWDEHDGERQRDQCAGAHADPPGDAGEHWIWDVAGGDEQDEQFHGAEHRDGDIERDGECERAVQCGVGRQLQSGRQREPDGDGGRSVRRWRATTIRV